MVAFDHHKFNDDLLLQDADRKLAQRKYPSIFHAPDHPELRDLFSEYDAPANRAKRTGLIAGLWAIGFGVSALAIAASEFLVTHPIADEGTSHTMNWTGFVLAVASGLCGLFSYLIGTIGVLSAERKRRWLYFRLMTERIRQFHFQTLIFRLPQILASLENDAARSKFLAERALWFESFRSPLVGKPDSAFTAIIREEEKNNVWLYNGADERPVAPNDSDDLVPVFNAYRELRILHQLDYADYKLHNDHRLISAMPHRQ